VVVNDMMEEAGAKILVQLEVQVIEKLTGTNVTIA
jgi:hypothetical protein